jgi:hypothetical protein
MPPRLGIRLARTSYLPRIWARLRQRGWYTSLLGAF